MLINKENIKLTELGTSCPSIDLDRHGPASLVNCGPSSRLLVDCSSGVTQVTRGRMSRQSTWRSPFNPSSFWSHCWHVLADYFKLASGPRTSPTNIWATRDKEVCRWLNEVVGARIKTTHSAWKKGLEQQHWILNLPKHLTIIHLTSIILQCMWLL